jgi:hypothetical protein
MYNCQEHTPGILNYSQESHRKVETTRRNPKPIRGPGKTKCVSVYFSEFRNRYIAPLSYISDNTLPATRETAPGLQKFFIIFFFRNYVLN